MKNHFVYQILNFLNSHCTFRIVHTAEVKNDKETEAIILFKPDRIGHGTFIFPSAPDRQHPNLLNLLKKCHIPVGGYLITIICFYIMFLKSRSFSSITANFDQNYSLLTLFLVFLVLYFILELCLTSNIICKSVSDYQNHHLEIVLKEKMPFVLCVCIHMYTSSI